MNMDQAKQTKRVELLGSWLGSSLMPTERVAKDITMLANGARHSCHALKWENL